MRPRPLYVGISQACHPGPLPRAQPVTVSIVEWCQWYVLSQQRLMIIGAALDVFINAVKERVRMQKAALPLKQSGQSPRSRRIRQRLIPTRPTVASPLDRC